MIVSFKDEQTRKIYEREWSTRLPAEIQKTAYRKLVMIHSASQLLNLQSPPGNRLEKLKGDRQGQFSIRVNDRWRICFTWIDDNAHDVEIVDYH